MLSLEDWLKGELLKESPGLGVFINFSSKKSPGFPSPPDTCQSERVHQVVGKCLNYKWHCFPVPRYHLLGPLTFISLSLSLHKNTIYGSKTPDPGTEPQSEVIVQLELNC